MQIAEILFAHVDIAPIEIVTIYDLLWWINFVSIGKMWIVESYLHIQQRPIGNRLLVSIILKIFRDGQ